MELFTTLPAGEMKGNRSIVMKATGPGKIKSAKVQKSETHKNPQRVQVCNLSLIFDCAQKNSFKSFLRSLPNLSIYDKLLLRQANC
jgi:hypothetical protein